MASVAHQLVEVLKVALEGGVELKAESLVEVQILASCSCSAAEDPPEKQHIDNSPQDLYFLITMTLAELTLAQAHEPNGLVEPQVADSQESGCTASLKAPVGWLQEENSQQMIQQLSSVMQVAALVEQDLAVVLVTQRKLPLVVY